MRRNSKGLVIGLLCAVMIFMGIGYAIFQSTLTISGTSRAGGSFLVEITGVAVDSKSAGATNLNTTTYTSDIATLNATFMEPGEYITYEITVENNGTIDAMLLPAVVGTGTNDEHFSMTCDLNEAEALDAGDDTTFLCTITFDSATTELPSSSVTATLQVTVEAIQKSAYTPSVQYVDQDDTCFVSVIPGEINYYKSSCGSSVSIPENVRLKTSTVTGKTFNSQICMAFAPNLKPNSNMQDSDFCSYVQTQVNNMSTTELFSSIYSGFVTPTFDTPTGEYNLINTIGASSFSIKNISSISIPNNITQIKAAAFVSNNLSSINFPNSITTLGDYSFYGNQFSGSLTLPNSLTSIGRDAFSNNYLSGTLTIPRSVTSIGYNAFGGRNDGTRNRISSLVFESGSQLQTIEGAAFASNKLEGTLIIPASVTSIGDFAFYGVDNGSTNHLTGLVFESESHLTTIGHCAFESNQISGTLEIPSGVTSIGNSTFGHNLIEELHLGSAITNIGDNAFYNRSQAILTDVYVDMTESNWNSSVTKQSNSFSDSPTFHFN